MGKIFSKKEKNEKSITLILVFIFLLISVIYFIIRSIGAMFNKPEVYYLSEIKPDLEAYDKEYSNMFYMLDNRVANFLEAVDKELYSDLYSILEDDYYKIYSRKQVIDTLKDYRENVFKYNDGKEHEYEGHLVNAYSLNNGMYLVQLDFNDNNFFMVFGTARRNYTYTFVE